MPESIENETVFEEAAKVEPSSDAPRPKRVRTKEEHNFNVLLGASIIQIVLSLLLYMITSVNTWIILVEAAVTIALVILEHFGNEKRVSRILLRTFCIFVLSAVLLACIGLLIYLFAEEQSAEYLQMECIFMVSAVLLPVLLFFQPVLVTSSVNRRRFDLVLLRILVIAALIFSLFLSFYGLEYKINGQQAILTANAYTFNLLGQEHTINIDYDCIFTRALFCICSGVLVVFSFLQHSVKADTVSSDDKNKGKAKDTNNNNKKRSHRSR